jgi:uncharacterized membrane protein
MVLAESKIVLMVLHIGMQVVVVETLIQTQALLVQEMAEMAVEVALASTVATLWATVLETLMEEIMEQTVIV